MKRNIVSMKKSATGGLGACLGHCPQDAIKMIERDEKSKGTTGGISPGQESELRQWPIQLALVSPQASYFSDVQLLVAAGPERFCQSNRL